jgi:hypothetical protein
VFQKNVFHRNPNVSAGLKRFGTPEHVEHRFFGEGGDFSGKRWGDGRGPKGKSGVSLINWCSTCSSVPTSSKAARILGFRWNTPLWDRVFQRVPRVPRCSTNPQCADRPDAAINEAAAAVWRRDIAAGGDLRVLSPAGPAPIMPGNTSPARQTYTPIARPIVEPTT